MAIRAVFLDIDGTLVDSNECHVKAWERALEGAGYRVPADVIRKQIGKGADMLLPALLPGSPQSTRESITQKHDQFFRVDYLAQVKAFPHAFDLIAQLHKADTKVVLASSANRSEVSHYVELLGVQDYLTATTCADDVRHSKPAGDLFARALEKVAPLHPGDTLAVGDTPYDVIAAAKCGIKTIALRSGGFSDRELQSAGAIAVYDSIGDLFAALNTSPLAPQAR